MVNVKVKNPSKKPTPVNEQVSKEDEDKLFQHILESKNSLEKQITSKSKPKPKIIKKDLVEPIKEDIKKEIKKKSAWNNQELKKKAIEKIIEKEEIIPEEIKPIIEETKKGLIEYSIKETTRYDLNWYYLKEKYVEYVNWLWRPYTKYVKWFNKSFNTKLSKEDEKLKKELIEGLKPEGELSEEWQTSDNLEDLYEKLPVLEGKYPFEKQELEELMKIRKALRKLEYEEDLSHNIIRSEK